MEKSYSCFPKSPDQLKHRFPWGRRGKSSLQTHRPVRLIKGSSITVRANNSGESSDKPSSGRQSLAALPSRLSPAPAPPEREQGGKTEPMKGEKQEYNCSEASRMGPAVSKISLWPRRASSWRGVCRLGWKEACRGGGGLLLLHVLSQDFLRSSGQSVLSHGSWARGTRGPHPAVPPALPSTAVPLHRGCQHPKAAPSLKEVRDEAFPLSFAFPCLTFLLCKRG